MNAPSRVRVSVPSAVRIVNPRDPYQLITSPEPRLYGHMQAPQLGDVLFITLDDGRDALVARAHVTTEPTP